MGTKTAKDLEVKLKKVNRGAYYFGVVGRLLIGFSLLHIAYIIAKSIADPLSFDIYKIPGGPEVNSVPNIIIGYLFLLARDAFTTIAALIKEIQEIV